MKPKYAQKILAAAAMLSLAAPLQSLAQAEPGAAVDLHQAANDLPAIPLPESIEVASNFSVMLIAEDQVTAPYTLQLDAQARAPSCQLVDIKIRGKARFEGGADIHSTAACDSVNIPSIAAGPYGDESSIEISAAQSSAILKSFSVSTIQLSEFDLVQAYWGEESYSMHDNFVLIDESEIAPNGPSLVVETDQKTGLEKLQTNEKGICIRSPFGPGKAKWKFNNPKNHGYGYLKENDNNAIFLPSGNATVTRSVDAMYRKQWGKHSAYKIPNSCTVTVNQAGGALNRCCNAAAWAAGKRTKWVNTGAGGDHWFWPSWP